MPVFVFHPKWEWRHSMTEIETLIPYLCESHGGSEAQGSTNVGHQCRSLLLVYPPGVLGPYNQPTKEVDAAASSHIFSRQREQITEGVLADFLPQGILTHQKRESLMQPSANQDGSVQLFRQSHTAHHGECNGQKEQSRITVVPSVLSINSEK